jgi:hypothetical protein
LCTEERFGQASDLKITFADSVQTFPSSLPRLQAHHLQLVADLIEPLLKFGSFELDANAAALASDPGFAGLLEFTHEQRIFEAAVRTRNAYRLVLKHSANLQIKQPYRLYQPNCVPTRKASKSGLFPQIGNASAANSRGI